MSKKTKETERNVSIIDAIPYMINPLYGVANHLARRYTQPAVLAADDVIRENLTTIPNMDVSGNL